jgi:hypothetical protein
LKGSRFESVEFKKPIEWAEREQAGQGEDRAKHQQDNSQSSGDGSTKVQISKDNCDDEAQNAVDGSEILFHDLAPFEKNSCFLN